MASLDKALRKAEKARLHRMRRHVFVCVDDDCDGKRVAKAMRKEVAGRGLRDDVTVSKVDCFDVCKRGAIAVVYPDGVWYRDLDEDAGRRVVAEHLEDGRVVHDHVLLRNHLDED